MDTEPRPDDLVVLIRDSAHPEAPPLLITGGQRVIRAVLAAVAEAAGVQAVPARLLRLAPREARSGEEPA